MGMIDWILLGVIAAAVTAAVIHVIRRKKQGGCCGDCASCQGCSKKQN